MSSNKYICSILEENFSQKYNFENKVSPRGITLDEFLKTPAFLESTPNNFIFSCPGAKNLSYFQQFDQFISFAKENPNCQPIQKSIFPLFCLIVMQLKKKEDQTLVQDFTHKYLNFVPEDDREDARLFVTDEQHYSKLACLFSTQRYKIKCDDETHKKIVSFLHKPDHSQLFLLYSSKIIIIPDRKQQKDRNPISRFSLNSVMSDMSIVQARISSASFAAISKEEPTVYACCNDQNILKIDTNAQKATQLYTHSSAVTTLSLSSQSKVLLTADLCGSISLWSSSASHHMNSKFMPIICSCFAPHGGIFAIGSGNGLIHVFDTPKHQLHRILSGFQEAVTDVAFHPNCAYIGSLSIEPAIRIWDLRSADTVRLFIGQPKKNSAIAFSNDGKMLAVFDGELCVFDIGTQKLKFKKQFHITDIISLHFSMDSRYIYAVSQHGIVIACEIAVDGYPTEEIIRINERVISSELLYADEFRIITTYEKESLE
ncbi:hypothetical protein M9Y10_038439 [Tritrichomonas musculus]|uniref:Anaphase-promoting complex subunit 4 WD40 domain-containing protein n=1 Tax=Tritrichomonas musculus TaxID=1915356 RepID=A0ABR2K8F5_9EUKA